TAPASLAILPHQVIDTAQGDSMEQLDTGTGLAPQIAVHDLEHQLRVAERHYAEARAAASRARDEWRVLLVHPKATPARVQALREKFDAVAARCNRLRNVIDELEERLDL